MLVNLPTLTLTEVLVHNGAAAPDLHAVITCIVRR